MNMANSTHLYGYQFDFLRQYSRARDLRHLKALAWMVSALICSGQRAPTAWEPYAKGERPKHKSGAAMATVLDNQRVRVNRMYLTRDDRVKRMEPSSSVSCPGHHRVGTGTA